MIPNNLTIEIFPKGSTARRKFHRDIIFSDMKFGTMYPGGLYKSCSFFIPQKPDEYWEGLVGDRLVVYSGIETVWEGEIASLKYSHDPGKSGITVLAAGYWAVILGKWRINKPWADTRLTDQAWNWTEGNSDYYNYDRENRLFVSPKGKQLVFPNEGRFSYLPPVGQLVKRVQFTGELQEGSYDFLVEFLDAQHSVSEWSRNTSGSEVKDITIATPSNRVLLRLITNTTQTPPSDGTIFGKFTSITVYTETGNINPTEIVKDIIAFCTDLNSTEVFVGSNTLSLIPFITNGYKTLATVLEMATGFGDASYNLWAAYLIDSSKAPTPNGKPVLVLEQYPSLEDYDYIIDVGDENIAMPFSIGIDEDSIYNWINVYYKNEHDQEIFVTPDSDANLKDTNSIAKYGRREYDIKIDTTSVDNAKNFARTFLKIAALPQYYISSPIKVKEWISTKYGARIPASYVRAGKRIFIKNYLQTETGYEGLRFIISDTSYDDASKELTLSCGTPDNLAIILAQNDVYRIATNSLHGQGYAPFPRS